MNRSTLLSSALFFTLGLLAAPWIPFSFWLIFSSAGGICFLSFHFRRHRLSKFSFALLFFLIGILRWDLASVENAYCIAPALSETPSLVRLVGTVATDPLVKTEESASFTLRSSALKKDSEWRPVSGDLHVFLSGHPLPRYGEKIMVEGILKRLKGPGNPGEFDGASFLKRHGVSGTLHVKPYHGLVRVGGNRAPLLSRTLVSLRRKFQRKMDRLLPAEVSPLFGAMILGERSQVGGELWDLFTRTGTVHLLSISGLHVGVFATLVYFLFKRLRLRKGNAFFFTGVILAAYAYLVGGSPPVVRSTVMIILYLLGELLGREASLLNTLPFAYLLLLLWNPFYLQEAGFQLSFLSVFFLFLTTEFLGGFLKKKRRPTLFGRAGRYVTELFALSLGVWIGVWPLVAYHFYVASPVGCIANCFVIPLLFPIVGLGVLWIFISFVPVLGGILLKWEGMLLAFLVWLIRGFDRLPLGSFHFFPGVFFVMFYYVALAPFVFRTLRPHRWKALSLFLLCLNLLVWSRFLGASPERTEVTFLDVGHGDAIYLEFPDKRNLLIDGGDRRDDFDAGRRIIAPFLWKRNIHRLDAVLVTHADQDHVGGIPTVLEGFRPSYLFESGIPKESPAYRRYQETLERLGMTPIRLHRGERIEGYRGVSLEVFHPPVPFLKGTGRDENNNGVVLKLTHGEVTMLFTGDIQEDGIESLERSGQNMRADILKMPHHGGEMGKEGASFLKVVSPEMAIISVGEREEHHLPSSKTLSLLNQFGIPTYQTVHSGAIQLVSDGKNISVETGRRER